VDEYGGEANWFDLARSHDDGRALTGLVCRGLVRETRGWRGKMMLVLCRVTRAGRAVIGDGGSP
jgi:hypothetical protein